MLFGDGGGGASSWAAYAANGCIQNTSWGHCGTSTPGDFATIPYGGGTAHLGGGNYAFADGHVKWIKGIEGTFTASSPGNTGSAGIKNGMTTHAAAGEYPTFMLN